jgi:putative transposase
MVAALLRPSSAPTAARPLELVGDALGRLRKPLPKVAALLEEAEEDLLAFYAFPVDHQASCAPPTRARAGQTARSAAAPTSSGIFPKDRSLIRLAASVVIEQNDEWLVGRRYLSKHSLEAVLDQEKKERRRQRGDPRAPERRRSCRRVTPRRGT